MRGPGSQVGRPVRLFAVCGLVFGLCVQLGWTPSAPYMPVVSVLRAADGVVPVRESLRNLGGHLYWVERLLDGVDDQYLMPCASYYQRCVMLH
jgi:hypothetical protein